MIKPVKLYIEPILHKSCSIVTEFSNLQELGMDMIETMFAYKAVGLAANQIGLGIQMAALNLDNKTKQMVICNPKILNQSKETDIMDEGCLSSPGMSVRVQRPIWVEFEYQLLTGEKATKRLEGYNSRIFFHEYRHLLGRTIVDHLMGL